ncbi:MAG: hypothetical protein QF464_13515, partial [Myxococcota bacterium]|nr:hypothetical protein [Myxococcota bacterium]
PVWSETQDLVVQGGLFRVSLGAVQPLNTSYFSSTAGLWLGVSVEGEPELPLRPLGATPYALVAGEAAGLSCSGCVGPEALSVEATESLSASAVAAVEAAGYHMAGGTSYDGDGAGLAATTVQGAIDELKALLDEATAGGGAITGNVNEGAGQVVAYELSRDIEGQGALKQYVHLVNPAPPKVIAYLYGDQTAVSINYIPNPSKTGQLNFNTRSHGGGYHPYHEEFWYPQWDNPTIYRYSRQGAYLGEFGSGQHQIMQVWGDTDGSYYTANWSYDRVYKWAGIGDNTELWSYHLGTTAGGVCSDGLDVYAMRHSGSTVWRLNKDTGEVIETFDLPNIPGSLYGGLVCLPERLIYARHPSEVRIYDLVTRTQLAQFSVEVWVDNMSFDGQTMWISNNSSTLYGYNLLQGNMYDELASGNWIVSSGAGAQLQQLRAPKAIEIWVDGVNVTDQVGNPNGKGVPNWDGSSWGSDGQTPWSSGQLDLTNVADWTLGEHLIEFRETGGVGGEIKGYTYVIYPFTESTPPVNDSCGSPVSLEVATGPVVVSGTTEDTMGKILATDTQNGGEGCSAEGGPDAIYRIDLSERSLINAAITSPFPATLYIRSGDCENGEIVY